MGFEINPEKIRRGEKYLFIPKKNWGKTQVPSGIQIVEDYNTDDLDYIYTLKINGEWWSVFAFEDIRDITTGKTLEDSEDDKAVEKTD